jgi:peptidoglycan/xylan/chitin deacetylase (PgdA/CDA1 family)
VLANLQPGEIVLMHVGSNPDDDSTLDADALPTIISELRARGFSFVTVAQFMDPTDVSTSNASTPLPPPPPNWPTGMTK